MRHALRYLKQTAGGAEAYLLEAGLTADEVRRLRAALLLRPEAGSSKL